MIPFGPWHPDSASINSPAVLKAKGCLPAVMDTARGPAAAFVPELSPTPVTDAVGDDYLYDDSSNLLYDVSGGSILYTPLAAQCYGLASIVQNSGVVIQFAGTAKSLYKLSTTSWTNVSRALGDELWDDRNNLIQDDSGNQIYGPLTAGQYAVAAGERWRFAGYNPYVIATNYSDVPQKYNTAGSLGRFSELGGGPPKARYIGVVRDQVVLACLNGNENAIQWSGFNNAELWTIGLGGGADFQSFPEGGPVTGFVGGAVGHVFQATRVTRMTFTNVTVSGVLLVYQFDEVQGGKGCVAPNSIVKVGDLVYYIASDGPQVLSISTGQVKPIGVNKWRQWFLEDYRPGSELLILGAYDPLNPIVKWAYVSNSTSGLIPGRILNYNWQLDEATYEDMTVEAMSQWLTSGTTLDAMGSSGNMETLPFSLDSPFWKGGVPLFSVIDSNHKLNYFEGKPIQAEFITADGRGQGRAFIRGTIPLVDTTAVTVAVAMRERDGDATSGNVTFPTQEIMEDTGVVSAHKSGNLARAQIIIPAGASWTMIKGIETSLGTAGAR